MKVRKVLLTVEASSTGFGVYADGFPITGYGDSVDAAKADFTEALQEVLESYEEDGTTLPKEFNGGKLVFAYKYDLPSIFAYLGVLDVTSFAKAIGMNASLLRQYKTGKVAASEKQKGKIEEGLHDLGRKLLGVQL